MKGKKKLGLASKTFIGFALGIAIGLIFKEKAAIIKPLGTIFLNMIKMIVVPMVFFSITAGVASLGDLRKLRNIGVKVVGLYAATSAVSVGIGLVVAADPNGLCCRYSTGCCAVYAHGGPDGSFPVGEILPRNLEGLGDCRKHHQFFRLPAGYNLCHK